MKAAHTILALVRSHSRMLISKVLAGTPDRLGPVLGYIMVTLAPAALDLAGNQNRSF
ncbi:hypothetical protein DPMN_140396 [Dreissena polymorpha]|uniref:Uncharacterized protein n=1 Tax=Dreissena polymorpha TaxID=45954 RepID=A0A9D4G826_DREPO|nr:hypothetical protein DPMN_140396 [Dreissena polymorpha]